MPLAHLVNTGLGPFYDGLAHLFTTPEDLLPVLALALLSGLSGPRGGRTALFVLPPAWMAGMAAGRFFHPHWVWPVVASVLTIVLGALAAADRPLPTAAVAILAAALGLWNGAWNGIELVRGQGEILGHALGVACAAFVVVAILSSLVAALKVRWARIAVRVTGSWIGAAALFMLGWSLR